MATNILPSIAPIDKALCVATDLMPDHLSAVLRHIYSLNLPKGTLLDLEEIVSAAIVNVEESAFAIGFTMGRVQAGMPAANRN